MITLPVYNESGETVGTLELDEKVLGKIRKRLMHEAVIMYEANRRRGTHAAKTKAQKAGSGKKLWRQKGTGRARIGQRRSPHRRGGGAAFGPKPRSYRQFLPKRAKKEALKSALLCKLKDDEVRVVEALEFAAPQTARLARMLRALTWPKGAKMKPTGQGEGRTKKKWAPTLFDISCVLAVPSAPAGAGVEAEGSTSEVARRNLLLSARNLPRLTLREVRELNAYEVLRHRVVLFTKAALLDLYETLRGSEYASA